MRKTMLVAAALLWTGSAIAEEVIIEKDRPPPASSTTTIEKHGPDCDSKTVHAENSAGDSKTVTHQDCD